LNSATNKSRLSTCLLLQATLFLALGAKLCDDILDRLDVFVLELQELYIPKPRLWEYVWCASLLFALVARLAIARNSRNLLKVYVAMLLSFSFVPVVYAIVVYFPDVKQFYLSRDISLVSEQWRNYPTGVLWYVFLFIAVQLHLAQLTFCSKLLHAWKGRRSPKRD
jgi:hypothetical protein